MAAINQPTVQFKPYQITSDGGTQCYDVIIDTATLADLYTAQKLHVIHDEQRGIDEATGRDQLSQSKVERWVEQELDGNFHAGQLTWCVRSENGGHVVTQEDGTLAVFGDIALADSRHRHEVLTQCEHGKDRGNGYRTRDVSVRIYPDTTPEVRRALFYDYNQEGTKADESRSKYLSPKTFAEKVAKLLVEGNSALTRHNVNTVKNRVTSKDPRLAGFNTFAQAVEAAWGKALNKPADVESVAAYLDEFWTRLVQVLPALGLQDLNERNTLRKASLVGSPLAIYGYLAVAKALREDAPDSLDQLAKLDDPEWFAFGAQHWKDEGIVVPSRDRRTGDITGWRVSMSFQTRSMMTSAMLAKMGLEA